MTLQMLIPTLFGRTRSRLAPATAAPRAAKAPAAAPASPQYRLVVLALAANAEAIDAKVRQALSAHELSPESATRIRRSGGYLLELDYVLRCERSRRAALVHLVSALGDTDGVHAIRWETAPIMRTR
ncbi:hypothetical protein HUS70_18890 [Pandoraea nosoerga]|uniref:Uncharacterized protein n=1 Tax=Pandoraea nosoerga TaxID=2508296 RepID=A0A5E4V4W2_9BURK|nr:hypothetical protein [Pandoraea nosoerga]MBN4665723.1 hypothetical protein [Pandoraea nosoerga]MBN4677430.1 hypothetical protein [Pandoraea nosoerga]MBN4681039.1 hypothetical protein [Pandoraea nosoerga]MBN4746671.1 hypothetical protein [Pandoraea nosoerga]VVE06883.1 hypothetical protein PNO31109_02419 [Pandoraea nosoerga]